MAKQITYKLGFDVEDSELLKVKQELNQIQQMTLKDFRIFNGADADINELRKVQDVARQVGTVLEQSFNPKLNSINLTAFNQKLKENNLTINQIQQSFSTMGAAGQRSFQQLQMSLLNVKKEAKRTHSVLDKIGETIGNTIRWNLASTAINTVTGKIQEAWGYAKKLDSSLNDIRIVTGKSADEMDRFAKEANKMAKSLGAATTNYTDAALIYYQQGLGQKDVTARTETTVKAANVTGQSASEVSEQLTAVWNGYKVVAEEAELYVDKLAAVAASTAADLEELSTGMSKVASAASTMGVNIDQLSAQLSTIVSVTRQDASLVGTALKTIYARMGDLKVSGIDEFGTSLGDVSSQLRQMGIDVLDQEGNLRDMGSVIEEVAGKWEGWTAAQQQAAAVAIAGKRQYNNLIALFDNWDMYESALTTSQTSAGTLQKQQDIYMDSLEAHLNQLSTAGEKVYDAFFDSESMKGMIDALTTIVDLFGSFIESIGGGGNLLLMISPLISNVLMKQVGSFFATISHNIALTNAQKREQKALDETIAALEKNNVKYGSVENDQVQKLIELKKNQLKYEKYLTEEQKAQNEALFEAEIQNMKKNQTVSEKVKQVDQSFTEKTGRMLKTDMRATTGVGTVTEDALARKAVLTPTLEKQESQLKTFKLNENKTKAYFENPESEESKKWFQTLSDDAKKLIEAMVKNQEELKKLDQTLNSTQYDDDGTAAAQVEKDQKAYDEQEKQVNEKRDEIVNKLGLTKPEEVQKLESLDQSWINSLSDESKALVEEFKTLKNGLQTAGDTLQASKEELKKHTIQVMDVNEAIKMTTAAQEKATEVLNNLNVSPTDKKVEAKQNIKDTVKELNSTAEEGGFGSVTAKTSNDKLDKESKALEGELKELTEKPQGEQTEDDKKRITLLNQRIALLKTLIQEKKNLKAAQDAEKAQSNKLKTALEKLNTEEQGSILIKEKLEVALKENGLQYELFAQLNEKVANGTALTDEETRQYQQSLEILKETLNSTQTELGEQSQELQELQTELNQTAAAQDSLNQSQREQQGTNQVQAIGAGVTQALGNVMALIGAFNMITELVNTANDENLSSGEKFKKIFSSVIGIAMSLLPIIITIITTIVSGGAAAQVAWWPILIITAAIIAVGAIIAGIVALVDHFKQNDLDKALKSLEKAKEDLAAANEQFKAMKDELQKVNEGFDALAEKQQIINDLTVGTEEWTKAVQDNNQAVMDLVSQYSDLAGAVVVDENGVMSIKQEAQEELEKKLEKQTNQAYANTLVANARVMAAQNKVDSLEAGKALMGSLEAKGYDDGKASEKNSRLKNTKITDHFDTEVLATALEKSETIGDLKKILGSSLDDFAAEIGSSTDQVAQSLLDEKATIYDNISAINANSDAVKKLEMAYASSVYADNEQRLEAESQAAWDAIAGNKIAEASKDIGGKATDSSDSGSEKDNLNAIAKQNYAESLGVGVDDLEIKDGKIKVKGADDSTFITLESAAEQANKYAAAKQVENESEQITKLVNEAYKAADAVGTGSLINLAGGQKSIAFDESETTLDDISKLDATKEAMFAKLRETYGSNDAAAKALGYGSYGEYELAYNRTKKNAESTVSKINSGNLNKTFNAADYSGMTIAQARDTADAFEAVFKSAGEEGTKALKGVLTAIEDPETQAKVANIASSIDWTDLNAENQFKAALEEAGIYTDNLGSSWNNVVKAMSSAANVAGNIVYQYANIRSQLAEIQTLAKDLAMGDIVSDEDYKKMLQYNSAAKDMFIQTADGYKFIGSSGKELQKLLASGYQDLSGIRDKFTSLQNSASTIATAYGKDGVKVSNEAKTNATTANTLINKYGTATKDMLASQGLNYDEFTAAVALVNNPNADTSSEEYKNAVNIVKTGLNAVNQAKNDYENGMFSDSAAIEQWVSYNASGWNEAKTMLSEQGITSNSTNEDLKIYEKFENQYKNQFLKELGLTLDSETVKGLNIDNLEKAVIATRKLELDYLQEINAEIEKNSALMETAFGSDMTNLLTAQIEKQKEAYNQAVLNKGWADTALKTALESSGYQGKTLTELLNIRATSENAEEIENLDSIIELYSKADDAAIELIESSQAVIDAQIENYEYQLKMQDKITKSLRRLRDLAIEFDDFASKGLNVFERETVAGTIKKSLTGLEDNGKDLGKVYGELSRYKQIADIDINYLNQIESLKKMYEANGIESTFNREDIWKGLAKSYGESESSIFDNLTQMLTGVSREQYSFFTDTKNNPFFNAESGTFNLNAFEESFGEALNEAHETLTSMREELQTLYDSYLQAQDEILELYDKEIQKLSTINDIYSTMADLSAIVGKNTSQYYSSIASNLSQSYSLAEQQYTAAQAEYNKLLNPDGSRKAGISQEMYDKVADNFAAAANNLTDLAQQTLEAVANNFSAQIKEAVNNAIEATHGLNLTAASESWELAKAANEGYLDEINARYNMDQLNRKIQTSIDESDNYAAQKKLADLRAKQEQRLNDILEERGKLSQYELDRANAEYELTLKQIALEEAQQTANKMKLTRDAMGNYTYQYVADQDAIAKAEEELAAAENNLYNIDKERNKSLVDEYYATMTEANEAIAEAMAQGDAERVERLREHYFGESGMIAGIQSELKASSGFLKEIGALVSGKEFSDNITQVADQITSMKLSGEDGLFTKINELIGQDGSGIQALSDATGTISDLLKDDGVLQTVVNSVSATQKNATDLATEVTELSNASSAAINKLPSLVENVKSLADELDIYAGKYQAWLDAQVDTTEIEANTEALGDLTRSINELKDTLDNGKIDGSISIEGWSFDNNTWTQNANNTK